MIQIAPNHIVKTDYYQAFLYCLTLNYKGHKDWRLPTNDEYIKYDAILPYSWYSVDDDSTEYILDRTQITPVRTYD